MLKRSPRTDIWPHFFPGPLCMSFHPMHTPLSHLHHYPASTYTGKYQCIRPSPKTYEISLCQIRSYKWLFNAHKSSFQWVVFCYFCPRRLTVTSRLAIAKRLWSTWSSHCFFSSFSILIAPVRAEIDHNAVHHWSMIAEWCMLYTDISIKHSWFCMSFSLAWISQGHSL